MTLLLILMIQRQHQLFFLSGQERQRIATVTTILPTALHLSQAIARLVRTPAMEIPAQARSSFADFGPDGSW